MRVIIRLFDEPQLLPLDGIQPRIHAVVLLQPLQRQDQQLPYLKRGTISALSKSESSVKLIPMQGSQNRRHSPTANTKKNIVTALRSCLTEGSPHLSPPTQTYHSLGEPSTVHQGDTHLTSPILSRKIRGFTNLCAASSRGHTASGRDDDALYGISCLLP